MIYEPQAAAFLYNYYSMCVCNVCRAAGAGGSWGIRGAGHLGVICNSKEGVVECSVEGNAHAEGAPVGRHASSPFLERRSSAQLLNIFDIL